MTWGRNMVSLFSTQLLSQSQWFLSIGKPFLALLLFRKQNRLNWEEGEEAKLNEIRIDHLFFPLCFEIPGQIGIEHCFL